MKTRRTLVYIFGLLTVLVLATVSVLTVFLVQDAMGAYDNRQKPKFDLPDDIPWDRIPWRDFGENFPWDDVPWDKLPPDTPWEQVQWENVPWDKLPDGIVDDIPLALIPWNRLPLDMDWENIPWKAIPWENLPEDLPWQDIPLAQVPWDSLPSDTPWEDIPWKDVPWDKLPSDTPWDKVPFDKVPWTQIPDDFPWENVPWDSLPEDFNWQAVTCDHQLTFLQTLTEATCVTEGTALYACSKCGATVLQTTDPTNIHIFDGAEWEHVTEPTCVNEGQERRLCIQCHEAEDTRPIQPTGQHTFDEDTGKCINCDMQRLILLSASLSAVYDGSPLTASGYTIEFGSLKQSDHTIQATYTGSIDKVGRTDNLFTVEIKDGDGNDVTDGYDITLYYGTLTITRCEITVKTKSATQNYNGSALTCTEFDCDGLAKGDRIEVVSSSSITERGSCANVFTVKIFNDKGEDVTSCYAVTFVYGTLTVV